MPTDADHATADVVLETLASTRAIRRYTDDPVSEHDLARIMFAATRAPSGSNGQPFRFLVLRDDPTARRARRVLGDGVRSQWDAKRSADGYERGSGAHRGSRKARTAATMQDFVDRFESIPVIVLVGAVRHRPGPDETIGASVYPACQNLLLAARALGYGGVMMMWHRVVEQELRELFSIPDDVFLAAMITLGVPAGRHGPVRRRPVDEFVFEGGWGTAADWLHEPPGTEHTAPFRRS